MLPAVIWLGGSNEGGFAILLPFLTASDCFSCRTAAAPLDLLDCCSTLLAWLDLLDCCSTRLAWLDCCDLLGSAACLSELTFASKTQWSGFYLLKDNQNNQPYPGCKTWLILLKGMARFKINIFHIHLHRKKKCSSVWQKDANNPCLQEQR